MSVSSPCEICQRAPVRHTCDRCARLVCREHFKTELGRCTECAATLGPDRDRRPVERDHPDGVDTYRF